MQTPDVQSNFTGFLSTVVEWMTSRLKSNRQGLAMTIIRGASKVFGGVGKYIVCEAFARAGKY